MTIVQFCSNTFAISEKLITQFLHIVALKAFQLTKKTFKVLSNGQFDFHYIIHQFLEVRIFSYIKLQSNLSYMTFQ